MKAVNEPIRATSVMRGITVPIALSGTSLEKERRRSITLSLSVLLAKFKSFSIGHFFKTSDSLL